MFKGEISFSTLPTTVLQIVCIIILYSGVIAKTKIDSHDNFKMTDIKMILFACFLLLLFQTINKWKGWMIFLKAKNY